MEIFLIRHTTPDVPKGICYGQADLDLAASFTAEAAAIRTFVPVTPAAVYSSPLQRCSKLAAFLFPDQQVQQESDLKELHFGQWELMEWSQIPQAELQPWMDNFVEVAVPGGESYAALAARSIRAFERAASSALPAVIVAHGGVIRSILAYVSGTPLQESFNTFQVNYGCVVQISKQGTNFCYKLLHNPK